MNDWSLNVDSTMFYLIAGDLAEKSEHRALWFANNFGDRNNYMFIKGNHDYYGDHLTNPMNECQSIVWQGLRISGATLWTDLSNHSNWIRYQKGLIDCRHIRGMNFDSYNNTHQIQRDYLLTSGADVIVSHHCPSPQSVAEIYKNSPHNTSFYSYLDEYIMNLKIPPKLWVHGHTHHEFDYMIGSTRVICHPMGYPFERKGKVLYEPKIIEV